MPFCIMNTLVFSYFYSAYTYTWDSALWYCFFYFSTKSEYYFILCTCTTLPHVSEESGTCVNIHKYMKQLEVLLCLPSFICMRFSQITK